MEQETIKGLELPQESGMPEWRLEVEEGRPLELRGGEVVVFTFQSEGEEWIPENPKWKKATVFEVIPEEFPIMKKLYVRSNSLKRQIARLGRRIVGMKVSLHRKGEGLATQWTLQKVSGSGKA